METEDVPEEYVDLLQTLIKMNVQPKGKNPQEIKAWMKAFVEQDKTAKIQTFILILSQ
jgi:hypothetical protein